MVRDREKINQMVYYNHILKQELFKIGQFFKITYPKIP